MFRRELLSAQYILTHAPWNFCYEFEIELQNWNAPKMLDTFAREALKTRAAMTNPY